MLKQTAGEVGGPPPRLGEHTREVLAGLEFSDREIEDMVREGIVELAAG